MNLLLLNNFSATIDIVALVILLAYALYGLIRGFAKTFFSVFGTLLGVLIAILIAPSVVGFLQEKYMVVDTMTGSFGGVVQGLLTQELIETPLSLASQDNLGGIASLVAKIVLMFKNQEGVSPDATIGEAVASIFSYYFVLILCVIGLFIILKLIFFVLTEMVKKAYVSKLVASLDRVLGLALGVFNGIFHMELIIMIISLLPIPFCQQITLAINDTIFVKFMQDINLYQIIMTEFVYKNILRVVLL